MNTRPFVSLFLVFLTALPPALAAPPQLAVSWDELRNNIAQRRLNNRKVVVTLADGREAKSVLLRAEAGALVLEKREELSAWLVDKEVRIPRSDISQVRFPGRSGHARLIGTLAGVGGGLGVSSFAAASDDDFQTSVVALFAVGVTAAAAVGGYFIGRSIDKEIPVFRINDRQSAANITPGE
jgi:hypothetical protein